MTNQPFKLTSNHYKHRAVNETSKIFIILSYNQEFIDHATPVFNLFLFKYRGMKQLILNQ